MKKFVLQKEEGPQRKPSYEIPYRELLNEQQVEAVFHTDGPALVVAGAGTGKTRTLTYRVARLVEEGVDPREILLLTFTRRASREMLNRAASVLDDRCRKVKGGTFHYYCSHLLHRYAEHIGYPNHFTIIDAPDAMDVLQLLRTELQYNKLDQRFPKKSTLYSILSTATNKDMGLHELVDRDYSQFRMHIDRIEELARQYREYKERNHIMDFDDLLTRTIDLLEKNDEVRQTVAARHRYVMVDEYQDTNALQARLTELFSSYHGNVMAVGDDAQSIYAFRGADHQNIMDFPKQFEGTRVIKLEENYRSTQHILNLTNRLLEQAGEKYDKRLFTRKGEGELPALVKAPNERDQSRFLSQMIMNLREQGYELNETAVLFRNGRDSYDLEVELNRKNIPFVKYGGQQFTEAAHVKDVLAHVRVLVNPQDTVAWNRLLMLLDGIGPKTARELFQWIRNAEDPYELGEAGVVNKRYLSQLQALSILLQDLKNKEYSVSDTIHHIVQYYKKFCEKHYDDHPKRLKDLETFVGIAENYRDLEHLLEELALEPIEASALETEASQQDEDPLVLSTIHSAKGLEWTNVFMIQCLDGVIPSGFSLKHDDELDEELRLLYVACTRAREHLFLTYPVVHEAKYGDFFTNPSRFIRDMDEQYLEPWVLVEEEQKNLTKGGEEPKQLGE